MTATPFRPRSVSELVDAAFQLLRRDHLQYALATALVYVPVMVAAIALGVRFAGSFSPFDANGTPTPSVIFGGLGLGLVFVLALLVIDSVLVVVASDAYRGHEVSVAAAFRQAGVRVPAVLGASLLKLVIVFGRTLLAMFGLTVIAGILAAVVRLVGGAIGAEVLGGILAVVLMVAVLAVGAHAWSILFAIPAATVLESTGPWRSVTRSRELSVGLRWHVFKALFLAWFIYLLLTFTMMTISTVGTAAAGGNRVVTIALQLVGVGFTIFVYPFISIVGTLLYYDARIRKEGYDLELMTQELGVLPETPAAPPAFSRPG